MGDADHVAYLADSMAEEIPEQTAVPVPQQKKKAPAPASPQPTHGMQSQGGRVKASPLARKLAREFGLDLSRIQGTGPEGRILKDDVLQAKEEQPATSSEGTPHAMSRTEQLTAERMSLSKREIPHFYLTNEVLFLEAQKLRSDLMEEFEEQEGVHLTYTDLIVRACARALQKHPRVNAHFSNGAPVLFDAINIGLAIAGRQGLIVPVIRNADRKSVFELGRERARLVQGAREGTLSLDDLEGGTFTLSNLGMMQVTTFCGIINHPQVCLLATGQIQNRVAVLDEEIVIAPLIHMTLSCDHRVIDGAIGASFLKELKDMLEEPVRTLY